MSANLVVCPGEPIGPVIEPADLAVEIAIKRRGTLGHAVNSDPRIIYASGIEVFELCEMKIGSSDFNVHRRRY
jgi:hypothetical protein